MSRKYTSTPEPRYVKLAQNVINGGTGGVASYKIVKDVYSVDKGFRVVFSIGDEEAEIEIPLEGTNDIIVDVDEENQEINVHLDNTVRTKLARALLIPTGTISEPLIVAIGTNGSQTSLKLGEGLAINGDTIESTTSFELDGTTLNITTK